MKKLPAVAIFFTFASLTFAQNLKIVNAASLAATSVAPNSIISIMGRDLASGITSAKDASHPPTTDPWAEFLTSRKPLPSTGAAWGNPPGPPRLLFARPPEGPQLAIRRLRP